MSEEEWKKLIDEIASAVATLVRYGFYAEAKRVIEKTAKFEKQFSRSFSSEERSKT